MTNASIIPAVTKDNKTALPPDCKHANFKLDCVIAPDDNAVSAVDLTPARAEWVAQTALWHLTHFYEQNQSMQNSHNSALTAANLQDKLLELALVFVDENESQIYNSTYRGKNKPTNVLSFGDTETLAALATLPSNDCPTLMLGDLIFCTPIVKKEAMAQGKPIAAHFCHLLAHGVLHLCGFDHTSDDEAEIMEQLERNILAELGLSDPYLSNDLAANTL